MITKTSGNRLLALLFTILVCVVISLISGVTGLENFYTHLYTHLYYFPVVLAGLWYHTKAVYVAAFLGLTHVLTTYFFVVEPFVAGTAVRFATLIVVAAAVGLISERHIKGEEELKMAQNFSESIIATVPDPLFVLDSDLKIKTVNHAFYETFRTNPMSTIGRSIVDIFGDKGEEVSAKLKEILGGKEQVDDLGIHYRSDRVGERVFNLKARRIRGAEEELVVIEDVTERKRAEEERTALIKELEESYRKLTQSNRELRKIVYITSHHLQEPTRKVQVFGNMLHESVEGKLDADERENLQFMIDSSQRMEKLVKDIRSYSIVITKEKQLKRVDLNKVIAELKSSDLAAVLEDTRGTIFIPETLLSVQADPTQIRMLMRHLIVNGLIYHHNGIAPEITIRSSREENMVRVSVEDNGIGIPKEHYDTIFEMFQQLHFSKKGTGIGLAVCKKIVEQHGGEIGVVSMPGEGSRFWFTIPEGRGEMGERRRENGGR